MRRFWSINRDSIERWQIEPLSPRSRNRDALFLFPYKNYVCTAIQPVSLLSLAQLKYQDLTVKIFLNYLIKRKLLSAFEVSELHDDTVKSYLFQAPFLNYSDEDPDQAVCSVIPAIEAALDCYYSQKKKSFFDNSLMLSLAYNEISYSNRGIKKKRGQYFTPDNVVDQMLDEGLEFFVQKGRLPRTILDPAGGGGVFLIRVYEKMKAKLLEIGLSAKELEQHLFDRVLWSYDTDNIAVFLMRVSLSFLASKPGIFPRHIYNQNFLQTNNSNKLIKFDWVVGNPPWGSQLKTNEIKDIRQNYTIGRGEIDSFSAFIEQSLKILPQGGLLSQLVPESLLNIRAHSIIRRLILTQCDVLKISTLGDVFHRVFAPAIYFHAKKEFMSLHAPIMVSKGLNSTSHRLVDQQSFLRNPHNIFTIYQTANSENIISIADRAQDSLKNHGHYYLGIVTGNNQKHIHSEQLPGCSAIITGKDVEPFVIRTSKNWIYFQRDVFQQVCDESMFRHPKKLLYKFISNRLQFAIDRRQRYHLNSVNGFYLTTSEYTEEYLQALLNSQLLNYYYQNRFFARRVLQGDLNCLPIAAASSDMIKYITNLSNELENALQWQKPRENVSEAMGESDIKTIQKLIENAVMDIYGIPAYLRSHLYQAS